MPYKNKKDSKAWRVANSAYLKKLNHKWYLKNKKTIIERIANWRKDNPEKVKKYNVNWQRRNPEYKKEWHHNNLDRKKVAWHKRETKKKNNGGSFTLEEWNSLCKDCNYRCLCCGKKRKLTADHVVPVSKGGVSDISNIQPLCKSCNSKKGTNSTDYRTTVKVPTESGGKS